MQTRAFLRVAHLLGIDRAVAFTVLARSWTIVSGGLTILLIARFLNPSQQGYYYTFASLVSLQTVFELGFSFVILQLAAHERAALTFQPGGLIEGDEEAHSRLASILQKAVLWYTVAALLMTFALIFLGYRFFSVHTQAGPKIDWGRPWISVVLASLFTFQFDPVFSFMEGCGFVARVAQMRLTQAILGSFLGWTALVIGHGLYSPAAIISGQAIAGGVFLFSQRKILLPLLRRNCENDRVSWSSEIWPFQWRMAVSFLCSYLIIPLFNPVLFAYRGASEAGRMGMSLTIATSLGTVAYAWVNTKAAPFGTLIARKDFSSLDRIFFRALFQSLFLLFFAEFLFIFIVEVSKQFYPQFSARLLPIPLLIALLLATLLNQVLNSEALYLRSHKREPLLRLSILVAAITCISTLTSARIWGATGVTVGYLLFGGILYLLGGTYLFLKYRAQWHVAN
jgi:hypothetical protein